MLARYSSTEWAGPGESDCPLRGLVARDGTGVEKSRRLLFLTVVPPLFLLRPFPGPAAAAEELPLAGLPILDASPVRGIRLSFLPTPGTPRMLALARALVAEVELGLELAEPVGALGPLVPLSDAVLVPELGVAPAALAP